MLPAPLNTDFTIDRAYQWVLASTKKTKKKKEKRKKVQTATWISWVCVSIWRAQKIRASHLIQKPKSQRTAPFPLGLTIALKHWDFAKTQPCRHEENKNPGARKEGEKAACLSALSVSAPKGLSRVLQSSAWSTEPLAFNGLSTGTLPDNWSKRSLGWLLWPRTWPDPASSRE